MWPWVHPHPLLAWADPSHLERRLRYDGRSRLASSFRLQNRIQYTQASGKTRDSALSLAWALRITADDLDSVGVNLIRIVELEVDILDDERPDIIAKAVGIEVALRAHVSVLLLPQDSTCCYEAPMNPP